MAAPRAQVAPPLTFTCVNPLDHADEIKQLFLAHERPEFPAFFDRAYPEAVAAGACSWVGRDDRGRICSHVVQFPRRFVFAGHAVRGALLGNLMVATAYRTFWPAVALLRRAVSDVRESGPVDLAYADPNALARPVAEAAGLRKVGALRRFVLPLADPRPGIGLGIRVYRLLTRWQVRATPLLATARRPGDEPQVADLLPVGEPRSLRPLRHMSLYGARLAGYPTPADRWYAFHRRGAQGALVGRALVRGPDPQGLAALCVWESEPIALLSSLLTALGDQLREIGTRRIEVHVMTASRAENEFRRAGFFPREEDVPVIARPFTALGAEVVGAVPEWRILPVDLDR